MGLITLIQRGSSMNRSSNKKADQTLQRANGHLWLQGAGFFLIIVLSILAMPRVWGSILSEAVRDEESSHILLVPFAAAWLVWVQRRHFKTLRPRGFWVGALILWAGVAAMLLGYEYQIETLRQSSVVLMIIGAAVTMFGIDIFRHFGAVVAILFLLLPIWLPLRRGLSLALQEISSVVVGDVLSAVGVDIVRAGNLLTVNDVPVNIVEACNGMRMVFAIGLVVYAFMFSQPYRWYVRSVVLVAVPIVALVCNIVRLVPTIWAYGWTNAELADTIHVWGGWLMVGVGFVISLGILGVLRWARVSLKTDDDAGLQQMAEQAVRPRRWRRTQWAVVGVTSIALLGLGNYSSEASGHNESYQQRIQERIDELPQNVGLWQGETVPLPAPAIRKLKPNAIYSYRFTNKRTRESFQLAIIHCQTSESLQVHTPSVCYPHAGWNQGLTRKRKWRVNDRLVEGNEYFFRQLISGRFTKLTVDSFFIVAGRGISADMSIVSDSTKLWRDNRLGGAQMQFVFSPSSSERDRDKVINEFLPVVWPVIEEIEGF